MRPVGATVVTRCTGISPARDTTRTLSFRRQTESCGRRTCTWAPGTATLGATHRLDEHPRQGIVDAAGIVAPYETHRKRRGRSSMGERMLRGSRLGAVSY